MTLLSVALIAGGLSSYGVGPVLTREISAASCERQPLLARIGGCWALKLTSVVSLLSMGFVLIWLSSGLGNLVNNWNERLATITIIPFCAWVTIPAGILIGLSRVAQGQGVLNVWKNLLLLVGTLVLVTINWGSPSGFLLFQAFGFVTASLIGIAGVRVSVRKMAYVNPTVLEPQLDRPNLGSWHRSARHFLSISLAWLVLGRIDVIVVNALSGVTQAGYFGAAARLAQFVATGGFVWVAWLQPRLSRIVRLRDGLALRRMLSLGLIGSISLTAVLTIIAWFIAPELLGLMGSGFSKASEPFRMLLLGYLFWGASVPFYALVTMANMEHNLAKILWAQFALTIALSIPLVSAYGALGAAFSWSFGLACGSMCVMAVGYRQAMRMGNAEY